ncbi:SUMF1/EgtB/PvdO family nonheme iron enzyme [Nocardia aurea]|uniref:SUMF1/EgtB/PvdO family nonheme iron enzyme n=1 Tax=Nocardia aurea TaxID=2144174 RepID=UPI0033A01BF6
MRKHCCTPGQTTRTPSGTKRPSVTGSFPADPILPEMVSLAGGEFLMGSAEPHAYPLDGEGPVRTESVPPYAVAATTVTVAQFDLFVTATGYLTDAERFGDSLVFEAALPHDARAHPRVAETPWWAIVGGADWRHPAGPDAEVDAVRDLADHPVVHVSRTDAEAFCRWSGTALPSEAQWEFASRGGLSQQPYPWGYERDPGGEARMNIWRGEFPGAVSTPTGKTFTAPARSYPPNGFGLFNTTGNVWEWTTGVFDQRRRDHRAVIRGGSHLCHESYCRRYRTSARSGTTPDSSSGHIGFRVITAK